MVKTVSLTPDGRDVLSVQPKYGHFRREHHVQIPPLPVLLSFLLNLLSIIFVHITESFSLPACPALQTEVYIIIMQG